MPNTVQSVERALSLLELVVDRPQGVGVRELAREADLKAPTAQQLLKTLQARGYLHFNPDSRQYHAGQSLAKLCQKIDPLATLRESLRAPLQAFHAALGETLIAQTMVNGEARILLEFAGNQPLTVRHGEVVIDDPHLWASGSVVLAWQSPAYLDQYIAARNWNAEESQAYRELLAGIRERGLAEMINVANSGVAAVGAPVFDRQGDFVCAVGGSVPVARWDDAQRKQLTEGLANLANEIRDQL